jgi:predicted phage terminase large subunit-like protein
LEGLAPEGPDPLGREAGEALWPEKYSAEDLERIRANVGDYDFEALYQQRPYRRSGNMFKREWFAIVEALPKPEEVVGRIRAWDKAGTASGEGGDWAVGVRMSITRDDVVYVEHVSRGRYTPLGREEEILRCAKVDREQFGEVTIWHQQDPASAGLDSAQATSLALAKKGFTARFEPVTGDKEVRAGPWSTACQSGRVRLVLGGWNSAFIEEHVAFPKGKFDDQVDAASWGYVRLNNISPNGGIFV